MSLKFIPFVVQTYPENNAVDVPLESNIRVVFSTDMDPASLEENFSVQVAASGQKVEGTLSYADRVAMFTPALPFDPGVVYIVIINGDTDFEDNHILGARSILQYPLTGVYTVVFTTTFADIIPAPLLEAPLGVVVLADGLILKWNPIEGVGFYEVELGVAPAFDSLIWKSTVSGSTTEAVPDVSLSEGNYFWRVRALDEEGRAGLWSETASFAIDHDISTDLIHIPGESYHPFDPPEPRLETPDQYYDVDPELDEITVILPRHYSADSISVRLVGTSIDGNVYEDHGEVPIKFSIESALGGARLLITFPEPEEEVPPPEEEEEEEITPPEGEEEE